MVLNKRHGVVNCRQYKRQKDSGEFASILDVELVKGRRYKYHVRFNARVNLTEAGFCKQLQRSIPKARSRAHVYE